MNERKVIRKCFWTWNFDKEEQWLNDMAAEGWALDKVGFATYHFKKCEPGEYTVRFEMRPRDQEYLDFMAETGAEYIGRMAQWIYFRKKTEQGPFEIFSDIDSRIAHLNRIIKSSTAIAIANLLIGGSNLNSSGFPFGWINLACAALLFYANSQLTKKKTILERDRTLHE